MSLSDRERAEGFHAAPVTIPIPLHRKRAEGLLAEAVSVTTPFHTERADSDLRPAWDYSRTTSSSHVSTEGDSRWPSTDFI